MHLRLILRSFPLLACALLFFLLANLLFSSILVFRHVLVVGVTNVLYGVLSFLRPFFNYLFNILLIHSVGTSVPVFSFDTTRFDINSMDICDKSNPLYIHVNNFLCNSWLVGYQHAELLIVRVEHLIVHVLFV